MRPTNAADHNNTWRKTLTAGAFLAAATTTAQADSSGLECSDPVSTADVTAALLAAGPNYYQNIPSRLRFDADGPTDTDIRCDVYRAADGMNGALCLSFVDAIANPDLPALIQPLGSYGDNAVDRLINLPFDPVSGTVSCTIANELLIAAVAPPFAPVETNPSSGQVCLRDVMRAPDKIAVQNAIIRDAAGVEISTGPLANNGSGCFALSDDYPAGAFEVISFEVDTFAAGTTELGHVANLVQTEVMETQLDGVWFVDVNVDAAGAGSGSLTSPYRSIRAFNSAQGSPTGPQAGDFIYIINGDPSPDSEPLILLDSQWLVGRGDGLLDALAAFGVVPPANSPLNDSAWVC